MKRLLVLAGCVVVLAGLVVMVFLGYRSRRRIRNVVLISIDTCRADHLSCYGYQRKTTPNIDAVAAEGVLFKSVVAPIPLTFPSHLSMLTGIIPPRHGVHDNNMTRKISDSNMTIAEILHANGYKTAAIVSTLVLDSKFGLDQGFDTYADYSDSSVGLSKLAEGREAEQTSQLACGWLEENKDEKFFLFLHYYDPHFPYKVGEPFATDFGDSLYAGEIAYTDHYVGRVIDKLKQLGLYDKTLLIITSDHGEMLDEHGETGHGYFIYESAIKVPLIVKVPGSAKQLKVDGTVGLVDIAPTICACLGISMPQRVRGTDLSEYFTGRAKSEDERYIYTESLAPTKLGSNSLLGVVNGRWKYIQTTRPELYDVARDPGETNNLVNEQSKRAHLMREHLKLILDEQIPADETGDWTIMDRARRDLLESLGYIGGVADESLDFDQTKQDPKDTIGLHEKFKDACRSKVLEKYERAKNLCRQILAERPDLELAHIMLAKIWVEELKLIPDKAIVHDKIARVMVKVNRFEEALEHWNEVLKLKGDSAEVHDKLGRVFISLKKPDEAIEHWNKSLSLKPDQDMVHKHLGNALAALGRSDEGVEHWTNSLEINPAQPELHDELAKIYYQKGQYDKVVEHWAQAVQIRPDWPEMLNNLAWILAAHKDPQIRNPQQALAVAQRACELTDFNQVNFIDTLAVAYAANGKFAEAIDTAQKAISLAASTNQTQLVSVIEERLGLYKTGRPYYDLEQ